MDKYNLGVRRVKCSHERLIKTINSEHIICSDCGSIVEISSSELKGKVNSLENKNKELIDWIRDIEAKNDKLTQENEALKKCLKVIL